MQRLLGRQVFHAWETTLVVIAHRRGKPVGKLLSISYPPLIRLPKLRKLSWGVCLISLNSLSFAVDVRRITHPKWRGMPDEHHCVFAWCSCLLLGAGSAS